ncbi:MAG: hypothetical protein ACE5GX_03710 [Thermoanaerobaculia bacterium]
MIKPSRRARRLLSTLVAAAFLMGGPALSAQAQADAISILSGSAVAEDRLTEISASLERIADALEDQRADRGLELLIQRMELSETRLQPIEARLRELRSNRESAFSQRAYAENNLRSVADRVDAGETEMTARQLESLTSQLELEIESLDSKLRSLDDEIAILENQAARQKREVEDWQAYVDRRLGEL